MEALGSFDRRKKLCLFILGVFILKFDAMPRQIHAIGARIKWHSLCLELDCPFSHWETFIEQILYSKSCARLLGYCHNKKDTIPAFMKLIDKQWTSELLYTVVVNLGERIMTDLGSVEEFHVYLDRWALLLEDSIW